MDEETRKKLEEWNKNVGKEVVGSDDISLSSEPTKKEALETVSPNQEVQPEETASTGISFEKNPADTGKNIQPISPPPPHQAEIDAVLSVNQNKNLSQKEIDNKELLARIRTYETDAAEAIKRKKSSLSSIVIAEQKAKSTKGDIPSEPQSKSKAFFYSLLSVALIAGGIGVLYGWYKFAYVTQKNIPPIDSIKTLIAANDVVEKLFDFGDRAALIEYLEDIKDNPAIGNEEIYAVSFFHEIFENDRIIKQSTPARFFLETLSVNAPLSLYRSLEEEFVYGIHRSSSSNKSFLIFKTNFFQNAFASMLNWENSILGDMNFITAESETEILELDNSNEEQNIATSTVSDPLSASPEIETEEFIFEPVQFRDEIIRNHDTRMARNAQGDIVLLYSFINETTLVITNNIRTFEEILRRAALVEFQ